MPTYTPEQIGVELTPAAFRKIFNGTKGGLFASVRNYVNDKGEIATHCFQIGVDYGKVVKRSIAIAQAWLDNGGLPEPLQVTYQTWIDDSGAESNRSGKGRVSVRKSLTLDYNDNLVIIAIRNLLIAMQKDPEEKQQGAQYDKEAKSVYSLDRADGEQKVYLRDCLTVGKTVIVEGEYDVTHTTMAKAIEKAIRRLLPVGKYRSYIIGKFDSLTLGGQSIMVDADGNAYQTTPELAKDVQLNDEAQDVMRQAEPAYETAEREAIQAL